ncbi:exopolyphosphatase [bacterium]|nr:exopolyphosphatase [bacterium]
MSKSYTLYTRSNFDGIVCASLLKELGLIDDVVFVHPKDIQDGKIKMTDEDITASLPYTEGVYMAFDHHSSEMVRNKVVPDNYIIEPAAPSSSRIIYEYFGGKSKFSDNLNNLMELVDNADCNILTSEDIINPQGWVLLNYLMDPRTGLGRFNYFRISNYHLMLKLVDLFIDKTMDEIMQDEDVIERIELYKKEQPLFIEQIKKCTKTDGNIAIVDIHNEEKIHAGNRFMVYALFPECNISIHYINGKKNQNISFAVGKSILNRTCPIDIGAMLYEFGGGGHINAGTCQVDYDKAEETLKKIINKIKELNK